jgi:thioredoxin reductase (NADPH)
VPAPRPLLLVETTMPGVLAVGDVRHGWVKRVASAVGDCAIAVRLLHDLAQDQGADERRCSARA